MNKGLDKIHVIDRAKLNEEFYFQSLLTAGKDNGLLSERDIEQLQYDCLNLLAYKTQRYNAGDSSSVKLETAQSIMDSIMFTVGLALKTYESPDDALAALENVSISDMYERGRGRIDTLIKAAKTIYAKLCRCLVETQNVFYSSTLKDGIAVFFKLYYPDYAAQEVHITADYPLYNPMPKLSGIEFIMAYLNAGYFENQFCGYFDSDDIHHLLCGYAKDYQKLPVNIYEHTLTSAIGCVIARTDCSRLDITKDGKAFLCKFFAGKTRAEITTAITKAVDELNKRFEFSTGLLEYIHNSLPFIVSKVEAAAREQTLDKVFFTPSFPEKDTRIKYSYGVKMDDEQYRNMINELSQCRYLHDKIKIIKEQVHSLADFEDVLLDVNFSAEEIKTVLCELGILEIAALYKKYQELSDMNAIELREQERRLFMSLQAHVLALSQTQQNLIAKAVESMLEE